MEKHVLRNMFPQTFSTVMGYLLIKSLITMSLSIAIITPFTFAITSMHASDKTERSNHANNSWPENIPTLDGQVWATCNS